MPAPKSTAETGRYDEVRAELVQILGALDATSSSARGRKVLLALVDSVSDIAQADDTINASFNYSPGPNGNLNLTAVLTLTPAPATRPAVIPSSSSA